MKEILPYWINGFINGAFMCFLIIKMKKELMKNDS